MSALFWQKQSQCAIKTQKKLLRLWRSCSISEHNSTVGNHVLSVTGKKKECLSDCAGPLIYKMIYQSPGLAPGRGQVPGSNFNSRQTVTKLENVWFECWSSSANARLHAVRLWRFVSEPVCQYRPPEDPESEGPSPSGPSALRPNPIPHRHQPMAHWVPWLALDHPPLQIRVGLECLRMLSWW